MTHPNPTEFPAGFAALGVAPAFLDVLDRKKITVPTPIQHACIQPGLQGKDIVGIAQTGTGKTLAFGIPMLQRLAQTKSRALVLVPTRELALQVDEMLQQLGRAVGIVTAVFIGGASMNRQREMLKRNPRVLIATPGRLLDHLQQRTVTLREVGILVLDEADRMLDMGFAPQINKILPSIPKERQTMLFSATMPGAIMAMATKHMKLPLRIEVAPSGTAAERVEQEVFIVRRESKMDLLDKILTEELGTVLLFSRTKHGAKNMTRTLRAKNHRAAEIHSNRSLAQRREALDGFKSGKYRILVATDIAARGIDVTGIALVLNYDLPDNPEDYVHRIGRTGRAGMAGHAISFATPEQVRDIKDIERLMRATLRVTQLPPLPPPKVMPREEGEPQQRGQYHHRRGGNSGRGGGRSRW